MSQSDSMLHQLTGWVHDTRVHSPRLNLEADGLLARLAQLQQRQQQIASLGDAPLTLGFYGSSVAGKHHMLRMIVGGGADEIYVQLGENTLDYLRHINPGNLPPSMGIRFTGDAPRRVENFPLLLTLFSESELAQRWVRQYQTSRQPRILHRSAITARLAELKLRRQPREIPGMSGAEFTSVVRCYHQSVRSPYHLDDALIWQMAELAPWLDLADRVILLSTLWGEHAALSSQWQQQARRLQNLGGATQVLAPLSLVVNNLLLPNAGFLIPATENTGELNNDVIVCPLHDEDLTTRLSISQQDLVSICAEITFTLSQPSALKGVDILDIPAGQLPYYQGKLQPDTVLVCNAVADGQDLTPVARMLENWVEETQPQRQSTLPRLVWAITPFDLRFIRGNHADAAVQRYITQSGKRWGTLQALDQRDIACLNEWLSAAVNARSREDRTQALHEDLNQQIAAQFRRFTVQENEDPRQRTERLIRALQSQAAKQGDLIDRLKLSRDTLHQCWLQQQQKETGQHATLMVSVDLFDDAESSACQAEQHESFAAQIFALWVNHLNQLSHSRETADATGLEAAQLQALCETLISTAYRLGLADSLETTLAQQHGDAAMAVTQAGNVLNDFVSWLGYNQVEVEQRPQSRINKGTPIFAPASQASAATRPDRLGENVIQGNAKYIFDWLVALLTRAAENAQSGMAEELDEKQKALLRQWLPVQTALTGVSFQPGRKAFKADE